MTHPYCQKILKPWGYELILTPPDASLTGKIHHVNQGARCSLQYHDKKQEVLTLVSGKATMVLEDESGALREIEMEPERGYFIKPFQKHRFKGVTDCVILEASTPEEGITVRLDDDYHRTNETPSARQTRQEGKVYLG
ncbi:cupin [Candidatus Shapirobacteria bacterium]|nr:cupin [Candidatus Shapirobacteria bacterium]